MNPEMAFQRGLDFTLKWEGGYSNHPNDKGKETKYGISKRAYPLLDIKALTKEQAAAIYHRDYWLANKLQDLAWDRPCFAIACFDTAVLMGGGKMRKLAQNAANAIPDGIWGPLTSKAFRERDDLLLVEMLCFYRRQEHRRKAAADPTQEVFLKGWINRVNDLQEYVRGL